jgi:hypothetical protein
MANKNIWLTFSKIFYFFMNDMVLEEVHSIIKFFDLTCCPVTSIMILLRI